LAVVSTAAASSSEAVKDQVQSSQTAFTKADCNGSKCGLERINKRKSPSEPSSSNPASEKQATTDKSKRNNNERVDNTASIKNDDKATTPNHTPSQDRNRPQRVESVAPSTPFVVDKKSNITKARSSKDGEPKSKHGEVFLSFAREDLETATTRLGDLEEWSQGIFIYMT
jgi:hypothetical protein